MKKLLLAGAAFAALTGAAVAADLPARAPVYKAPPMVQPAFSWTGFYIGLNGGYGWGSNTRTDADNLFVGFWDPGLGSGQTMKPTGGLFGGQIGYNVQVDPNWVLGVELMGDWASLKKTDPSIQGPAFVGDSWRSEVNGIMLATARVAYAVGNWLPYVKGGYGGANLKSSMFDTAGNALSHSDWRNGWTVGAGFEYAVTPNWIVGVEYDYVNLGKSTWSGNDTPSGTFETFTDKLTVNAVLGRVSYKFGGGPIFTKY